MDTNNKNNNNAEECRDDLKGTCTQDMTAGTPSVERGLMMEEYVEEHRKRAVEFLDS